MAYLKRDDILGVQDFKTAEVDVTAEWGGVVLVRELTAAQVQQLGFSMYEGGEIDMSKDRLLMTRVAAWGIVDEAHNPIFTEGDIAELGRKSYAATQRIATKILNISGLGGEETAEGNE